MKRIFFSAVALALAGNALAAPSVALERVRQRYPWNGLVDFDYTVSGVTEADDPADYRLVVTMTAVTNGVDVSCVCSNFTDSAWCDHPVGNGTFRTTWNAQAELGEFSATAVAFELSLVRETVAAEDADYMIVDLTAGSSSAARYPVRFVRAPQASASLFNTDRYKRDRIVLKRVKAGTFRMGNCNTETGTKGSADASWHTVTLTEDYFLALFPMTQRQNQLLTGTAIDALGGDTEADFAATCPRAHYSRQTFLGPTGPISNMNARATWRGLPLTTFNLPTEAQFEYACRAGTTTKYHWHSDGTEDFPKYSWYAYDVPNRLHTVGRKLPNDWGFYDMVGNCQQWCLDAYGSYADLPGYDAANHAVTDPLRTGSGNKVCRGLMSTSVKVMTGAASGSRLSFPENWTQGSVRFLSAVPSDGAVSTPAARISTSQFADVELDLCPKAVRKLSDATRLLPFACNSDANWSAGGAPGVESVVRISMMAGSDPGDPSSWVIGTGTTLPAVGGEGAAAWTPDLRSLYRAELYVGGADTPSQTACFDLTEATGLREATDISVCEISLGSDVVPYTGSPVELTGLTVRRGATLLVIGRDYNCSYADNVEIGTACVTVLGLGEYRGECVREFQVVAATPERKAEAEKGGWALDARVGGGGVRKLSDIGELLPLAVNSDAGWCRGGVEGSNVSVCVTTMSGTDPTDPTTWGMAAEAWLDPVAGEGESVWLPERQSMYRLSMAVDGEFREVCYFNLSETAGLLSGRPISDATVEIAVTDVAYTGYGSELPSVVVTCDGQHLEPGLDYVCTYSNNVDIGTATVFVNGVGDFAGVVSFPFNVVPATSEFLSCLSADVPHVDTRTNEVLSIATWRLMPGFAWNTSESFKSNPFPEWKIGGLPASDKATATISVAPVVGWTADPDTGARTPVVDESKRQVVSAASGEGAVVFKCRKPGLYEARLTVLKDGVWDGRTLTRLLQVSCSGLVILLR